MIAQNQNNQNITAPIESFDGTQAQEEIRKRKSRRSKYDVSHLYEEGAMGFQSGFVPDAVKDAISGLTAGNYVCSVSYACFYFIISSFFTPPLPFDTTIKKHCGEDF